MLKIMEETTKNNTQKTNDGEYVGVGGFVLEIIKIVLLAFCIIVPIRVFLFQPFFVQGASMEPNFENEQYLIINELGYKKTTISFDAINFFSVKPFREIERGKVLVFRYPRDPKKYFIKRVIGLPGEKIEIKNGLVKIYNAENPNGITLDEKAYLAPEIKTAGDLVLTLANNEYFMLGDNRMASSDSRYWGPVTDDLIVGEVLFRAWPLTELKLF